MDWKAIKTEYITGDISYRKLAEKHRISFSSLEKKARADGWAEQKRQYCDKLATTVVTELGKKDVKKTVDKLKRVSDLTDKLLDKLEKAIEELDTQFVKDVVRTKTIEYSNKLRPDKPTKETIHEEEKIIEVRTIIDRSGLKAISSSLRDIKEIQMLKSDLDRQEQEARIKKLEHEAKEEETDTKITIEITGDVENWSK